MEVSITKYLLSSNEVLMQTMGMSNSVISVTVYLLGNYIIVAPIYTFVYERISVPTFAFSCSMKHYNSKPDYVFNETQLFLKVIQANADFISVL